MRRLSETWSVVSRAGWLAAIAWPRLLAWFLLGWGLRLAALRLAALAAVHSPLWGLLILPLAVVARLGSYIAMFWVLRDALPGFRRLRVHDKADLSDALLSRPREVFAVAILPFFTLYTAVKFLEQDYEQFARWALANTNPFDQTSVHDPTDIGSGVFVIALIVGAFLLRFLLKRLGDRLPWWVSVATVYLEALWVLLAVPTVWLALVHGVPQWLSHRRATAWLHDTVLTHVPGLEWTYHTVGALIGLLLPIVSQPIGWLAVAGVIYSRALISDTGVGSGMLTQVRGGDRVRQRWERLHPVVRNRSQELVADLFERVKPLIDAGRLIAGAGLVPITLYVLAYTAVDVAPDWLFLAVNRIIGPHELDWWMAVNQPLVLVCRALVEPVRICVIAAAYDFCLRKYDAKGSNQTAVTSV